MKVEAAEATWRAVRGHLEAQQTRIFEAIRDYPPPITGCDAQFDHLLEQRNGISRELKRQEQARKEGGATENATENVIAAFIASSPWIEGEADLPPPEGEKRPEQATAKRSPT